jgi:uncharacterized protein (TIGR00290 family)
MMFPSFSFFCSWSGGKDSCLSLHKAMRHGGIPKFLLTTCVEEGGRSHSHGLSLNILEAQSLSLEIPFVTVNTSWSQYRDNFVRSVRNLKGKDNSITRGVFGDIDIESHGQWERDVCRDAGVEAYLPLWKMDRKSLLREFLSAGFKAMIIAIDSTKLDPRYLGRVVDEKLIKELEALGIDSCGENGEYHTVVFDGPIFKFPLHLKRSEMALRSGYYFLDVHL